MGTVAAISWMRDLKLRKMKPTRGGGVVLMALEEPSLPLCCPAVLFAGCRGEQQEGQGKVGSVSTEDPACLHLPQWPGSASKGLCLFRSESLELTQQNLLAQPCPAVALATVLKPRPPFHPPEVAEEISALLVPHLPRSGDRSHSSAWAASLVDSAGHTDPAGHRWPVAKGGWKQETPSQVLLERTIPGAGMLGQAVGPVSDIA